MHTDDPTEPSLRKCIHGCYKPPDIAYGEPNSCCSVCVQIVVAEEGNSLPKGDKRISTK